MIDIDQVISIADLDCLKYEILETIYECCDNAPELQPDEVFLVIEQVVRCSGKQDMTIYKAVESLKKTQNMVDSILELSP